MHRRKSREGRERQDNTKQQLHFSKYLRKRPEEPQYQASPSQETQLNNEPSVKALRLHHTLLAHSDNSTGRTPDAFHKPLPSKCRSSSLGGSTTEILQKKDHVIERSSPHLRTGNKMTQIGDSSSRHGTISMNDAARWEIRPTTRPAHKRHEWVCGESPELS